MDNGYNITCVTCVITFLGLVVDMKKVNNNPWFVFFSTSVNIQTLINFL